MVSYEDFRKLELKVAKIISVEDHPNADKLYILTIEIGSEQKKIIAGIKAHYKPEELVNKLVAVVNNLEPATIRGVESNGMMLAASDDNTMSILTLDRPVKTSSIIK